jgi:hypothetical protein
MEEHDPWCEANEDSDQKVLDDIAVHGWHVAGVLDWDGLPGWAYSVGLYHRFKHPEIVVFGLDSHVAHVLINIVGDDAATGKVYTADELYPDLIDTYSCMFKPVNTGWYEPFLGYAEWFYDGADYPVLQCLWPDHDSRFPWDPEFNPDWVWAQPLLFHEDPVEARAVDLLNVMYPERENGN